MKKLVALILVSICIVTQSLSGETAVNASSAVDSKMIAEDAQRYLMYIGTNLKNRNIIRANKTIPADSQHESTVTWIMTQLKMAGIKDSQVELQKFNTNTFKNVEFTCTNIVVTQKGKSNEKQVVVGAHYDGEGCGDNGSGIALLLAQIKGMQNSEVPYTIQYVFFDGEERGYFGSRYYSENMTDEQKKNTLFIVNMDSLAFGDYCNIYGGVQDNANKKVNQTDAYDLAVMRAKEAGLKVYTSSDLDGYFQKNGKGPEITDNTIYTNPWTYSNPAPTDAGSLPSYASPSTGDWGDQVPFLDLGIPYLYMEATNWYTKGKGDWGAYTGYYETDNVEIGEFGMFMNTEFDSLVNLDLYFPGRALAHFNTFSNILINVLEKPVM